MAITKYNADDWLSSYKKSSSKISKNSLTTPTSWFKTPVSNPNPVWRPLGSPYDQNQVNTIYSNAQWGWLQIWSPWLQTPVVENETIQGAWLNEMWIWTVNNNIDTMSIWQTPNFTALKNTYGDFFAKNINTNSSLQSAIQSSFSKWEPEYDYGNMKTYMDQVANDTKNIKLGWDQAIQKYLRLKQANDWDLGKNILLDEYLKSQWVDPSTLKYNQESSAPEATFQLYDKSAIKQTTPTVDNTKVKQDTVSDISTSTTPIVNTTKSPDRIAFYKGLEDYKLWIEKDKLSVMWVANKYWIDSAKIEEYYNKQTNNFINWVEVNQNVMSGAFDNLIKDSRTYTADQLETFQNTKKAALEDARIKWDKDLLEKEKYYNEVERTIKWEKIRNRNNDLLIQQQAIAMWSAVGERFWTWSVRYYNDAVRESDLVFNELENKLLSNKSLRVSDLANMRAEYNNTKEKIENSYLANVQTANKSMMDQINSIILQKWKSSTDALTAIKDAKLNYWNILSNEADKRYQSMKSATNDIISIDSEANKIILSATQQQLEAEQARNKLELVTQQQSNTVTSKTWSTITWPLSESEVDSVISITWWVKLSNDERISKIKAIQELASKWMSLNDIRLNFQKKINIDSPGIFTALRDILSNEHVVDLSNVSQLINNWNPERWIQELDNQIYANAKKTLGKDDIVWLSTEWAIDTIRKIRKIKELADKLTIKSWIWLALTWWTELLKSDQRQDLESALNDVLSEFTKEISWTAASDKEVERLKWVFNIWNLKSIDDMKRSFDREQTELIDKMNTQRNRFWLPRLDIKMLEDWKVNYSKIYFPK